MQMDDTVVRDRSDIGRCRVLAAGVTVTLTEGVEVPRAFVAVVLYP